MAKKDVLIISLLLILLLTSCDSVKKAEQTKDLMGTVVTIIVYDQDKEKAENAVNSAFNEIERIDKLLSNYNNKSEAYLLNKESFIENPSKELTENINAAVYYGNLSNGAFDVTVQPILDLYTYTFTELERPPTEDEVSSALELVNYKDIFIKKGLILFRKENMKITLGGIAKGYIIDNAIEKLKEVDIEHALVNAGGDMRAIGSKGEEEWQIALQNPRDKEEFITVIPINNKAVATSGDYERYFDDDKKFHHIVDPRTGYSATELISVTVIADNAMDADALATSVFVLGSEKGLDLVESLDDVEALIITAEKGIIKSSGFG